MPSRATDLPAPRMRPTSSAAAGAWAAFWLACSRSAPAAAALIWATASSTGVGSARPPYCWGRTCGQVYIYKPHPGVAGACRVAVREAHLKWQQPPCTDGRDADGALMICHNASSQADTQQLLPTHPCDTSSVYSPHTTRLIALLLSNTMPHVCRDGLRQQLPLLGVAEEPDLFPSGRFDAGLDHGPEAPKKERRIQKPELPQTLWVVLLEQVKDGCEGAHIQIAHAQACSAQHHDARQALAAPRGHISHWRCTAADPVQAAEPPTCLICCRVQSTGSALVVAESKVRWAHKPSLSAPASSHRRPDWMTASLPQAKRRPQPTRIVLWHIQG